MKYFLVLIIISTLILEIHGVTYQYKYYSFKKKRYERTVSNLARQCEESPDCKSVHGLALIRCIRKCMSDKCYSEMYAADELEEGEIDVRYMSFKGCVVEHKFSRRTTL